MVWRKFLQKNKNENKKHYLEFLMKKCSTVIHCIFQVNLFTIDHVQKKLLSNIQKVFNRKITTNLWEQSIRWKSQLALNHDLAALKMEVFLGTSHYPFSQRVPFKCLTGLKYVFILLLAIMVFRIKEIVRF